MKPMPLICLRMTQNLLDTNEREIMKNHKITITFNTHCLKEELISRKGQIFKYLKTLFFNTKNMEWKVEEIKYVKD